MIPNNVSYVDKVNRLLLDVQDDLSNFYKIAAKADTPTEIKDVQLLGNTCISNLERLYKYSSAYEESLGMSQLSALIELLLKDARDTLTSVECARDQMHIQQCVRRTEKLKEVKIW